MKKISLILNKELRATLRDKKALMTILLPILIYPVIIILFLGFTQIVQSNLDETISVVAVDQTLPKDILAKLENDRRLEVILTSLEDTKTVDSDKSINAYVGVLLEDNKETFKISYNSTIDANQQAVSRVRQHLADYEVQIRDSILQEANIIEQFENIVIIGEEDISGDAGQRILAMMLGIIVPLLIVLYGITGTYTISSDLSAGEKERETLETIFSVPIKRFEIVVGKLLTCVIVGLLSGLVNIISLFPLVYVISASIPEVSVSLSFPTFLYLFLMLIPTMIFSSALFIGLGFALKTYQESQSYGSVVLIGLMALCYIPMIPNIEVTPLTMAIPITNSMLLMREAFLGNYALGNTLIVLGVNLGFALAAVALMNQIFKSDWVIFGGGN